MASGAWQINNYPSTATAASASIAAPASAKAVGQITRLRSLQATVACGATAQTPIELVVRDGASGTGTVIASFALAAPADGFASLQQTPLDLRASLGNALTVEFAAANVAASQSAVSAQGDFVPQGYPMFQE